MALIIQFQPLMLLVLLAPMYPSVALGFGLFEVMEMRNSNVEIPPEFESFYYTQTIDHFNYRPESNQTFPQRYIMNSKYWSGPNTSSPIFVYAGAEANITLVISQRAFVLDLAAHFNALVLFIEHRYYGESYPLDRPDYLPNATTLGYLSTEQALADYAQLITDIKKNFSAQHSPVIAVGGSYGGMLAAWLRLKYPHIVKGALASSAPILYFDDITPQDAYFVVVSNDFKNTSESCYSTIKESWSEIDRVAAQSNGLLTLQNIFKLCIPFNSADQLKGIMRVIYSIAAQYDNPAQLYVENVCRAIDEAAAAGSDILGRIAAGINASMSSYCEMTKILDLFTWQWQTCTELVFQRGTVNNNTMLEIIPFDIDRYTHRCLRDYGITPKPNWIRTQYGGHDIKSVLKNFASNIIFSNGLRDPWSAGGVLEDISDSVVAIHTEKGAHCLDIANGGPNDPDWLIAQRDEEINIIASWLQNHTSGSLNLHLFHFNLYLIGFLLHYLIL